MLAPASEKGNLFVVLFCRILPLPYFQLEFPVGADQFKIGVVGGDQPGAVRPRGERDEHVEMQVA